MEEREKEGRLNLWKTFLIISKGYKNSRTVGGKKEKGGGVKERRWGYGRRVSVSETSDRLVRQKINLL